MLSIATILLLGLSAVTQQTAPGGSLKGGVVDLTGAGVTRAFIRVLEPESHDVVARTMADESGEFQSGNLRAGSYIAVLWAPGFHGARLPVVIRDNQITDLGKVRLEFAGCDAPGVICDDFGLGPPDRPLASGYLELNVNCGVDFRRGKVHCPDASGIIRSSKGIDVQLVKDGAGTYLSPANGATLAVLLPMQGCADAKRSEARVRLDGFGPGDELCVGTPDRHLSHIFFEDDVQRDSPSIRIYYATR